MVDRNEGQENGGCSEETRDVVRRWGRSVGWGPRHLDSLVTRTDVAHEQFSRLAVEVLRRIPKEIRRPGEPGGRRVGAAIPAEQFDLTRLSIEELRVASEHAEICDTCKGETHIGCASCRATGQRDCGSCGGSGMVPSRSARSNRMVQCRECRHTGKRPCERCNQTGRVTCTACAGFGSHVVSWSYTEQLVTMVQAQVHPAIKILYPQLFEERFLSREELADFSDVSITVPSTQQSMPGVSEQSMQRWNALRPALHATRERVQREQYCEFSIHRQDVRYEMCGVEGVLTLTGSDLVPASTSDALRPIQRRKRFWAVSTAVFGLATATLAALELGRARYFQTMNLALASAALLAWLAGVLFLGALFRAWRPRFRRWPVSKLTWTFLALACLGWTALPVIRRLAIPKTEHIRAALAAKDTQRARLLLEALKEADPASNTRDLWAQLEFSEALGLSGNARLAKLDEVVLQGGQLAEQARTVATQERLVALRNALDAKQPEQLVQLAEQWKQPLQDNPDAAELKALAFETMAQQCTDALCRLGRALESQAAKPTATRHAHVQGIATQIQEELSVRPQASNNSLEFLHALRSLSDKALRVQAFGMQIPQLVQAARATQEWVDAQRRSLPLVGAPLVVAEELLQRNESRGHETNLPDLERVAVFISNNGDKCAGLYVVGSDARARSLSAHNAGIAALIQQATGRTDTTFPTPPPADKEHATTHWTVGSVNLEARWQRQTLMELRIGSTPR